MMAAARRLAIDALRRDRMRTREREEIERMPGETLDRAATFMTAAAAHLPSE